MNTKSPGVSGALVLWGGRVIRVSSMSQVRRHAKPTVWRLLGCFVASFPAPSRWRSIMGRALFIRPNFGDCYLLATPSIMVYFV